LFSKKLLICKLTAIAGLIGAGIIVIVSIIFDKQKKISGWLVIPGIITVLAFTSFLYLPEILEPVFLVI